MKTLVLKIADDYVEKFESLLEALPEGKVIKEDEDEDEEFARILHRSHRKDFVPRADVYRELVKW